MNQKAPTSSKRKTFEHWVTAVAIDDDDPRGDFIRDTRRVLDPRRWKNGDVATLDDLHFKMLVLGQPCEEAFVQAEVCWAEYTRWAARKAVT